MQHTKPDPVSLIATQLDVAVATIKAHRRLIMDKLNIHSIAELSRYAVRDGIAPLAP